jgi:hypothetical protein
MSSPQSVALDVFITACERRLGANAPVPAALRRLRRERTPAALDRARTLFDALPGGVRAELASVSYRAAFEVRRAGLTRVAQKFGLIGTLNRRR